MLCHFLCALALALCGGIAARKSRHGDNGDLKTYGFLFYPPFTPFSWDRTNRGIEQINASLPSETANSPPQTPQKNLILVDVREPAELTSTGIIPTAVAVPLASQPDALFLTPEEFETRFGYPKPGAGEDKAGDVVFYCKAGVRARAAAQLALQAGYEPERVGVYDGSWLDWAKNGGRVEKWEGEDYE